jgi:hypothetical protein
MAVLDRTSCIINGAICYCETGASGGVCVAREHSGVVIG